MAQSEKMASISTAPTHQLSTGHDSANAIFLFAASNAMIGQPGCCDVVLMTTNTTELTSAGDMPKYHAALTYRVPGMSPRWSIAATGQPRDSLIPALESLLFVLAAATEKYQGNIVKSHATAPVEIAGGMIDETAVLGRSWKASFFGGENK